MQEITLFPSQSRCTVLDASVLRALIIFNKERKGESFSPIAPLHQIKGKE